MQIKKIQIEKDIIVANSVYYSDGRVFCYSYLYQEVRFFYQKEKKIPIKFSHQGFLKNTKKNNNPVFFVIVITCLGGLSIAIGLLGPLLLGPLALKKNCLNNSSNIPIAVSSNLPIYSSFKVEKNPVLNLGPYLQKYQFAAISQNYQFATTSQNSVTQNLPKWRTLRETNQFATRMLSDGCSINKDSLSGRVFRKARARELAEFRAVIRFQNIVQTITSPDIPYLKKIKQVFLELKKQSAFNPESTQLNSRLPQKPLSVMPQVIEYCQQNNIDCSSNSTDKRLLYSVRHEIYKAYRKTDEFRNLIGNKVLSAHQLRNLCVKEAALYNIMPSGIVIPQWELAREKIISYLNICFTLPRKTYQERRVYARRIEAARQEVFNLIQSVDETQLPCLAFYSPNMRYRAFYHYLFKNSTEGNYPKTLTVFNLNRCHLVSNTFGGPSVSLNIGTMTELEHAVCSEAEYIVSKHMADSGAGMRLYKNAININRKNLRKEKKIFQQGVVRGEIARECLEIKQKAYKLDFTSPTYFLDSCNFITECIQNPSRNPFVIATNCNMMTSVSARLGAQLGAAEAYVSNIYYTNDEQELQFFCLLGACEGAAEGVKQSLTAYGANLALRLLVDSSVKSTTETTLAVCLVPIFLYSYYYYKNHKFLE